MTEEPKSSTTSMVVGGVPVEAAFAEAFDMKATRVVITAADDGWLRDAVAAFTGFGTSVIACDMEIAVERWIDPSESPDGRVGASVLALAMGRKALIKNVPTRVGQCLLTCPSTSVFAGLPATRTEPDRRVPLGKTIRFFGDGYQISKRFPSRHLWRVPVMDGEFVCEHETGSCDGIGGGNFLIIGKSFDAVSAATRAAISAIDPLPDVITPFPGGAARSGSKVGSKYEALFASTNEAFCPSLRGLVDSNLHADDESVLEVVIDGLSFEAIATAIRHGIHAAIDAAGDGLTRITAGNYGGKLGPHHFHLHQVLA